MNRNAIQDILKQMNTKSLYSTNNSKCKKNIHKDYNSLKIRRKKSSAFYNNSVRKSTVQYQTTTNIKGSRLMTLHGNIKDTKNTIKYVYKSPIHDINNVEVRLNVLETQLKKEQIKNQKYSEVYKKLLKCTDEIFKTKPSNDIQTISNQITPYDQSLIKSSIPDRMIMIDKKKRNKSKLELLTDTKHIVSESSLAYKRDDTQKESPILHKTIIMSRLPFDTYEKEIRLPRIRKNAVITFEYKKKILIAKIIRYMKINKSKLYTNTKINKNIHTILLLIHREIMDLKQTDKKNRIIDNYYNMNTIDELKHLYMDLGLKKKGCLSPLYRFFIHDIK